MGSQLPLHSVSAGDRARALRVQVGNFCPRGSSASSPTGKSQSTSHMHHRGFPVSRIWASSQRVELSHCEVRRTDPRSCYKLRVGPRSDSRGSSSKDICSSEPSPTMELHILGSPAPIGTLWTLFSEQPWTRCTPKAQRSLEKLASALHVGLL